MSIRTEKIGVGDQAEGVILSGTVRARNYMGGFTHYTVQIGDQTLRLSRRNAHSHEDSLEIGGTVQVGFRETDARVLGQ
nr:TOBE domain-containing protein [uncultured Celeribacter sp.]